MVKIGNFIFQQSAPINCMIRGRQVLDARLYIGSESSDSYQAWICHNDNECDGDTAPNKFGYRFSWTFTLYKNGQLTDDVSNLKPAINGVQFKPDVQIDPEIVHFLKTSGYEFNTLFIYKLGLFDDYHIYEMSKEEGFINLKNNRKSVEIKLGRFIRQMATKFNEIASKTPYINKLDVTDRLVETLHNKFVAYQKGSSMVHFLSGDDILNGYKRVNYLDEQGGTLHNSCMSDKLDFLKIYTQNPNQVELGVIYFGDKIAARTLVWTAIDGKKYHDRVYYRHDWLEPLMQSKLSKMGINSISVTGIKMVQLEKWDFEYYPYVDNFYYFDKKNGTMVSIQLDNFHQLRNTNGRID